MKRKELPFDPKDNASVIAYLDQLETSKAILENAVLIYSSECSNKKDVLENVIRYGSLDVHELSNQHHMVGSVIRAVVESNIPISEDHQTYLVAMERLIADRIYKLQNDTDKADNARQMIALLEQDLDYVGEEFTYSRDYTKPVSVMEGMELVQEIGKENGITAKGLLESLMLMVEGSNVFGSEEAMNNFKEEVIDRFANTVRFEIKHKDEGYWDLPAIQAMKYTNDYCKSIFSDCPEKLDKVDDILEEFADAIEDDLDTYRMDFAEENGFNPDPFNIYNLTPFPVGQRTVNRTMYELVNADTDDEVMECLQDMARLSFALEMILLEDNVVRKGIRKVGRAEKKVSVKVGQVGKEIKGTANDLKHVTVTPISRYLNDTYDKMKAADMRERREIIQKGRKDGTVAKISRAIKKGIIGIAGAAVIGGAAGGAAVGAVLAGISLLVMYATDRNLDRKEKQKIVNELEDELRIVEEKIEDSRGDDDKSSKYELMRIRNRLKRELSRLKMGGDFNTYDDVKDKAPAPEK